jgi:hypothetical protein
MRTRALIAVATALPLLVVGSAQAAGHGCTHLVVDADRDTSVKVGDDALLSLEERYDHPGLDIVSADLRSNRTQLTAVVRLAGNASADLTATTGQIFHVEFDEGLNHYEVQLLRTAYREKARIVRNTTTGTNAEGQTTSRFSADGKTLSMTVPAASFTAVGGALPVAGTSLTHILVGTEPTSGVTYTGTYVDTATTKKAYRAGSASC